MAEICLNIKKYMICYWGLTVVKFSDMSDFPSGVVLTLVVVVGSEGACGAGEGVGGAGSAGAGGTVSSACCCSLVTLARWSAAIRAVT